MVKLARRISREPDIYPILQANDIWQSKLHAYSANFGSGKMEATPVQTPDDFVTLCKTAYNLSLQFRSSQIDYEWQQNAELGSLSSLQSEVLGTTGVSQQDPHRVKTIVFGAVVRAGRNTGRLQDGKITLLQPSILIDYQDRL